MNIGNRRWWYTLGAIAAVMATVVPVQSAQATDFTVEIPSIQAEHTEILATDGEYFLVSVGEAAHAALTWIDGQDSRRLGRSPSSSKHFGDFLYDRYVEAGREVERRHVQTGQVESLGVAAHGGAPTPQGVLASVDEDTVLFPWEGSSRVLARDAWGTYLDNGVVLARFSTATAPVLIDLRSGAETEVPLGGGSSDGLRRRALSSAWPADEGLFYAVDDYGTAEGPPVERRLCYMTWDGADASCEVVEARVELAGPTGAVFTDEDYSYFWKGALTNQLLGLSVEGGTPVRGSDGEIYFAQNGEIVRLTAEGSLVTVRSLPHVAARVTSVALTPSVMMGADSREPGQSTGWSRSMEGRLTMLPARATAVLASAGRSAFVVDKLLHIRDRDRPSASIKMGPSGNERAENMSGPYLHLRDVELGNYRIVDARGRQVRYGEFGQVYSLFGPTATVYDAGEPSTLTDLRSGEVLHEVVSGWVSAHAGSFLALYMGTPTDGGDAIYKLLNRLTGEEFPIPQGDGVSALTPDVLVMGDSGSDTLWVYDLARAAGGVLPVPTLLPAAGPNQVAVDGNRIAYVNLQGNVTIETLPFGGSAAPILLGALDDRVAQSTSKPWLPEFDLTKPLRAGKLLIRNSAGVVVRELATPVSLDGSLRGIQWDVKTATGQAAPSGVYSWELHVTDNSGQGAVDMVDMVMVPKGTITVSNAGPQPSPSASPTVKPSAAPTVKPRVPPVQPVPKPSTPPAEKPFDVYVTPGEHSLNGRKWRTRCEPYSSVQRCFTDIQATVVAQQDGKFVQSSGWAFNNLTYTAGPRSLWNNNPLAASGDVGGAQQWTAPDGRNWRTECDTANTGRGGCRSYIRADMIAAEAAPHGSTRFVWKRGEWLFNNMVRFSE